MVLRRKKLVRTHAVALWSMVGACAMLLAMLLLYVVAAADISSGTQRANPAKHPETASAPSLFGTVTGVAGEAIMIDSKQSYTTILTDDLTRISALGGAPFRLTELRAGAVLTATGADLGDGTMTANAIVIISNPGTAMPVIGAPTEDAPTGDHQLKDPFTLVRNDGSKSSRIIPTATSTWWLSADGKTLLNIEGSVTTKIDLSTRHIVQ